MSLRILPGSFVGANVVGANGSTLSSVESVTRYLDTHVVGSDGFFEVNFLEEIRRGSLLLVEI